MADGHQTVNLTHKKLNRFESFYSHLYGDCSLMVEHWFVAPGVVGSSPTFHTKSLFLSTQLGKKSSIRLMGVALDGWCEYIRYYGNIGKNEIRLISKSTSNFETYLKALTSIPL